MFGKGPNPLVAAIAKRRADSDEVRLGFVKDSFYRFHLPVASVAMLDARLTGDQEVAGLTLHGLVTFFRGDMGS